MKDKERNLENISLGMILKWISEEKDPNKVRAFKGFLETAVAQYEADDAALMKEV